jgi:hypothetical protein
VGRCRRAASSAAWLPAVPSSRLLRGASSGRGRGHVPCPLHGHRMCSRTPGTVSASYGS